MTHFQKPAPASPSLLPVGILLFIIVAVVHGGALSGGWRFDDHYQLLAARRLGFFAALSEPSAWRDFSPIHYTPWLAWLYRFDSQWFGLNPAAHYLHLLLSLCGVGWLTFYLLLRQTGTAWALLAAIGGIAGAPALAAAQYLPGRHYVDGLLFALLALLCRQRWLDSNRQRWLAGSALAGLLALMCKEIFLPLCVVLPALGCLSWRRRWLIALWHGAVCLIFLLWRSAMLGEVVGGYDHVLLLHADWLYLPWNFLLAGVGDDAWGISAAAGFVGLLAVWLVKQRAARLSAPIITLALMLPFLALPPEAATPFPLESPAGMRLFLLPVWLGWATLALMGAHFQQAGRRQRYAAGIISLCFIVAALQMDGRYAPILRATLQAYDQQNAFIATHGPEHVLLPGGPMRYWAANARDAQLKLYDRIPARFATGWHDLPDDAAHFWQYSADCRCTRELPRAAVSTMPEFIPPKLQPLALQVTLQRREPRVLYQFGPRREQAEFAVMGQGWPLLELLSQGNFVIAPPDNAFPLRFSRRVGAAMTVSEPLFLPAGDATPLVWQRGIFAAVGAPGLPALPEHSAQNPPCPLTQPAKAELWLQSTEPLALFGEAATPDDHSPTTLLAALTQNGRIGYLAPLYRMQPDEQRAGTRATDGLAAQGSVVGFGIQDADLSAVASGDYELEILAVSPTTAWRCRAERRLHLKIIDGSGSGFADCVDVLSFFFDDDIGMQ